MKGLDKNIFAPLLVGHKNGKSLGFVRKNFLLIDKPRKPYFDGVVSTFQQIKKSAPRKERIKITFAISNIQNILIYS